MIIINSSSIHLFIIYCQTSPLFTLLGFGEGVVTWYDFGQWRISRSLLGASEKRLALLVELMDKEDDILTLLLLPLNEDLTPKTEAAILWWRKKKDQENCQDSDTDITKLVNLLGHPPPRVLLCDESYPPSAKTIVNWIRSHSQPSAFITDTGWFSYVSQKGDSSVLSFFQ